MGQLKEHQQDWEELAEMDPMWAVLSSPDKSGNQWDVEEFYGAGNRVIEQYLEAFRKNDLPEKYGSVLDFGCGLGRLSYAWSPHAEKVTGVDISAAMVRQAAEAGRSGNCNFVHIAEGDLSTMKDEEYDLVFTDIVLQHIPGKDAIVTTLEHFIRICKPGGVIAFQLPSHLPLSLRFKYRRPIYHILRKSGFSPEFLYQKMNLNPMFMNWLPVSDVMKVFSSTEHIQTLSPDAVYTRYFFRKPS